MGSAQSTSGRWTVQEILLWSQGYLEKLMVSDSPRLDCELLLAHALGWDRMQLYLRLDQEVPEGVRGHYRENLKRRSMGEPIAYLLGYKDFWKHRFKVSSDVLIPRPDTETLVEAALGFIRARSPSFGPLNVLDVGSGSGCISLSLLLDPQSDLTVTGWDIASGALEIARANAKELVPQKHQDRISFVHRDARQAFLPQDAGSPRAEGALSAGESYHVMVSNPPYICLSESAQLQKSVLDYEPHGALFAEENGLEYYYLLAAGAGAFLTKGGLLLIEIGSTQGAQVKDIFAQKGWLLVAAYRDLGKRDRVLALTPGSWEDLKTWMKGEEVDSLKVRQTSMGGRSLEYGALTEELGQSQKVSLRGGPKTPCLSEDSQKITSSSSAQPSRLEVYYEQTLLSQEEEKLLAQYGAEDTQGQARENTSPKAAP